jgi:2-methylcitrate dehydratase PrpD
VNAVVDRALHEDQTRVTIRLKGGRSVEIFVEHAIGSLGRPMSDADLEGKFRAFDSGILSKARTDRLIALCWDIDEVDDAADIARASVPQ